MPENTQEDSANTQDQQQGGAASDDGKLALTPEELDAKIQEAVAAAVKADRKKAKAKAAKKAKADDDSGDDAEEDDEAEDADEIISKAERRAAEAEQRAADAEKRALLASVENKLRDYLALNFRDLIGNAPDIMLHIEKALTPGAKDAEMARLIDSHSKAFAERTKAARKPAPVAAGARGRIAAMTGGASDNPTDRQAANAAATAAAQAASAPRPFGTINWHG